MYRKSHIIFDWVSALLVYLFALLIIPLSDKILGPLSEDIADVFVNRMINVLVVLVFIYLLIYLVKKGKQARFISYLWLFGLSFFSICLLSLVQITRDRFHFVGYGILTLLLYRALRHNIGTKMLYFVLSFAIMLFAVLDETLQLSGLGGRAFEIKDIAIDWMSGLIGLAAIIFVLRPRLETAQIEVDHHTHELKKMKEFEANH